jgi:cytoskeleton protein RodZ
MASQPTQISEASARRAHLKEVTNEAPPDSLGANLRAARLKIGQDLNAASKITKIKPEYLEALEEGRIDALPGRTYAIGFLRTYSASLGLDANACVARLKADFPAEEPTEAAPLSLPEADEEMRVPQGLIGVIIVIVIAAIFGGIYLFRSASQYMDQRAHPSAAPVEDIGPPSDQTSPGAGDQPGTPTAGAIPETSSDSSPSATAPPVASTSSGASSLAPAKADAAKALAAKPATSDQPSAQLSVPAAAGSTQATSAPQTVDYERALAAAPRTFGVHAKDNRVVLRANDPVFVRVETSGARNEVLFEGTLNKGEVYFVPAIKGVVLVTRNGGALDLYVDGMAKGEAGPSGIALKDLPLDADSLKERP